jgi:hypothetical protein
MSLRSDQTSLVLPFPRERWPAVTLKSAVSLLPVLIVLHQETSTPGRVGNALRALGHPLDIRRPRFGDALPETLDAHAGAVIFGGPMSANDGDDYVRREIDWIEIPLREGTRAARTGRIASITGTARALNCLPAASCSPRAMISRYRHSSPATRSASSFILM